MIVGAAQAQIDVDLAAPLFEHRIERDAETVAVLGMDMGQPYNGLFSPTEI